MLNISLNPLNAELNPIRHLLPLVGARHIVHVSRVRLKRIPLTRNKKAYICIRNAFWGSSVRRKHSALRQILNSVTNCNLFFLFPPFSSSFSYSFSSPYTLLLLLLLLLAHCLKLSALSSTSFDLTRSWMHFLQLFIFVILKNSSILFSHLLFGLPANLADICLHSCNIWPSYHLSVGVHDQTSSIFGP